MSTLRVDNIKGRTGSTVNIPDSNSLSVSGSLNVTGVTTFSAGAELNLQGVNLNSGTRGDVLAYDSTGKISKISLGGAGQVLKSDGTDLQFGDPGGATNVYYVSKNGVDASGRGGSLDASWASVKYACSNLPSTPTKTNPAVIFVKAGTYEETQLPIIVPEYTTIVGDNLRATTIKPAAGLDSGGSTLNTRSTLFRCSNGVILQDLICDGMGGYTPGSPGSDPTAATLGGVYLALNAASVISTKSPYIYNVTTFGTGATGAVVDGSLHSSGNRSMLFHTVTHIHSDGLGVWAKDNANAEIISGFTYYCQIGYTATGGSKIRSLNSSNSYGEFGVFSKGFDTSETANTGTVNGTMLSYTGTITGSFTAGEQITGGTSGATAYIVSAQSEPKVLYIVSKTGTFQSNEVVTGGSSSATATLVAGTVESNQSGRILVTQFASSADPGDSLQFSTTDGNAYQIQSVSSVTANSVAYHVLVFSTSRATPVASGVQVNVRKEYSQVRLTGHDFLNVGTGGTDTTNWPDSPSQNKAQANQVVTLPTDPGRVYYVATDEDGNFYVGDQFKVEQATGQVTLDSSAFDLSGLESLQLGSIGGLIGASVNEFSTDITLSQNSNNKVPTQAAVKSYVDNTSAFTGNLTIAGITTVGGDLHVGTGITMYASAGIISATTYYGDGTNLTGVDASAITDSGGTVRVQGNTSGIVVTGIATIAGGLDVQEMFENVDITTSAFTGTINHNLKDSLVFYSTGNASGNWTANFRGDGNTTLNDMLKIGQSITVTVLVQQGSTAYRNNAWQIDGASQTPKWLGGVGAPTAGNASAIDYYTYTIIKTANATFTILANHGPYS
jgi:hypothetical protein